MVSDTIMVKLTFNYTPRIIVQALLMRLVQPRVKRHTRWMPPSGSVKEALNRMQWRGDCTSDSVTVEVRADKWAALIADKLTEVEELNSPGPLGFFTMVRLYQVEVFIDTIEEGG